MSLPTTIRFVDKDLKTISYEFYNCGWWVPKDIGETIAGLYSEEQWDFVMAYSMVFDREGDRVGSHHRGSWYIYDDEDYETIAFLKNEIKKDKENIKPPNAFAPISISVPIIRRLVPDLWGDLIGVQPMTAPTGKIFSIKHVEVSEEPKKLYFTRDDHND